MLTNVLIQQVEQGRYRVKAPGRVLHVTADFGHCWSISYAGTEIISIKDKDEAMKIAGLLSLSTCQMIPEYQDYARDLQAQLCECQEQSPRYTIVVESKYKSAVTHDEAVSTFNGMMCIDKQQVSASLKEEGRATSVYGFVTGMVIDNWFMHHKPKQSFAHAEVG